MRRLIRERPSVIGAYVLIVIVSAFVLFLVDRRLSEQRDSDQRNLCELSLQRWEVQREVIVTITEPIVAPPGQEGDSSAIARLAARNAQFASQRQRLSGLLGARPTC